MRAVGLAIGMIVLVFVSFRSSPASAQARRRRPRTPISQAALPTALAGVGALGAGIAFHLMPPTTTRDGAASWRGGIVLDEGTRDGMRLQAPEGRETAASISDALMIATVINAVVIDAMVIPLAQDDPHLSWQATTAYALALGVTLLLNDVAKETFGRARPYQRECAEGSTSPSCVSPDTYASFYSGHTAVAFTSAGFSCAMHLSRSLYGDTGADAAACGGSLALAAATGLLRIVADRHYLSDVVVGALIGFVVGYLVPLIFVPDRVAPPEPTDDAELENVPDDERISPPLPGPSMTVMPMYSPGSEGLFSGTVGLSVSGTF